MWGSAFWCWDSWTSATWMFFSLNKCASVIFLLEIPEMLIWMMFRLLCCLCCCVCFGCVSDCVLVARTVCKRRCFTFTRRERGCPLELSALVAWVIPFKDRGNGTGTPPARDSTGVAPSRLLVIGSVMVLMLGSLWSFLPTWPMFPSQWYHVTCFSSFFVMMQVVYSQW